MTKDQAARLLDEAISLYRASEGTEREPLARAYHEAIVEKIKRECPVKELS